MSIDRRERPDKFQLAVDAAVAALRADMWTAMPGIVEAVNFAGEITADINIAVQAQQQDKTTGAWSNVNLPKLIHCPIVFPGGGGVTFTFPVKQGDEVLVVFASRCIDAWWQSGGVQPQAELRMHDLSDGFCIPRVWSKATAIANVSTTHAQLRSDDGLTVVDLDPVAHSVSITAPGGIVLNGPLQISGPVTAIGGGTLAVNFETSGDMIAGKGTGDQVGLQTHKHPDPQGGQTGSPVPGT